MAKKIKKVTVYGYVRVSTREQHEDRQVEALREFGVDRRRIIMDKLSGKDFDRPNYQKLVHEDMLRGDLLVVKSIDRLGRNYEEILEEWRFITKSLQADIVVLDMPLLDTREDNSLVGRFIADVVLQVLSFVAENERINIRQRQMEGILAAKARGVKFGRPRRPLPDDFPDVVRLLHAHDLSLKDALAMTGLPRSTFYNAMNRLLKPAPADSTFAESAM